LDCYVAVEVLSFERALDAHGRMVKADVSLAHVKIWVDSDFILDAANTSFGFKVLFTLARVMVSFAEFA
jgi:hypothetical protein